MILKYSRIAWLIAICMMVIACLWMPMMAMAQGFTPSSVYGHISVDGTATGGVSVSISDGQSTSTDGSGYYQFGISEGVTYTITASYNGFSASNTFTALGSRNQVDLNIDTVNQPTPTPTPTPTPEPSVTPTPKPGQPTTTPIPGASTVPGSTATPMPTAAPGISPGILTFENNNVSIDNGTAFIVVTRTGGSSGVVTVDYKTQDISALAGTNYIPASGTLTFSDGEMNKSFTVTVLGGIENQSISFIVILNNPGGGASIGSEKATVVIKSFVLEPGMSFLSFDSAQYKAYDYYGNLTITILREGDINRTATVDYSTVDGTAVGGVNYIPASGKLTFNAGENIRTINVTILDSNINRSNGTFIVQLKNPTEGVTVAQPSEIAIYYPHTTMQEFVSTISQGRGFMEPNGNAPASVYMSEEDVESMASSAAVAAVIGISIGIFGVVVARLLEPVLNTILRSIPDTVLRILKGIIDVILGYFKGSIHFVYTKFIKSSPIEHTYNIVGLSLVEIIVGVFSILLLGVTFAYSSKDGLTWMTFAQCIIAAGLTIIICDFSRRILARRYNAMTEFKFWDVGTLTLLLTAIFLKQPFSQPGKTVVEEKNADDIKAHGIISLIGPYTALLLAIVFLCLKFASGIPDIMGDLSTFVGPIADKGVIISMVYCVYSLLPFDPMVGKGVFKWSKAVWVLVFIPAVSLYFFVVLLFMPVPSPGDLIPFIGNMIFHE